MIDEVVEATNVSGIHRVEKLSFVHLRSAFPNCDPTALERAGKGWLFSQSKHTHTHTQMSTLNNFPTKTTNAEDTISGKHLEEG